MKCDSCSRATVERDSGWWCTYCHRTVQPKRKRVGAWERAEKVLRKQRKANRRYYERHREKVLARCRAYQARNQDKVREKNRRWREQNRERVNSTSRAWCERNKEKVREANRRWRAKNRTTLLGVSR